MALDIPTLTTAIKDGIETNLYSGAPGPMPSQIEDLAEVIATAIINHFETYGVINTTVASGIPLDVDPGTHVGATTGTGSGTGTIT